VWTHLKNAITQTFGTILGRIERVTYKDWFDAEREHSTINKNNAYNRLKQRNHSESSGGI